MTFFSISRSFHLLELKLSCLAGLRIHCWADVATCWMKDQAAIDWLQVRLYGSVKYNVVVGGKNRI